MKMLTSFTALLLLLPALLLTPTPAAAQGLRAAGVTTSTVTTTNAFVVSIRPTTMFSVTAYNASASDLYLLVFDATSLPANNTVPSLPPLKITANTTAYYDFNVSGCRFANGLVAATSTTPVTLTNGTASFLIAVTHTPN
jgi:hypothetical protein